MTAWDGAALMAGTAGAAAAGSGRIVSMEWASGITALRPMFSAAARRCPLASPAASLQRRRVSPIAALSVSTALAAALLLSMALAAAHRLSMALAAGRRLSTALAAAHRLSTALAAGRR